MVFRLVQKSVTLNDLERRNSLCYFSEFDSFRGALHNKNSSADEIANVNFYAVRPEGTRIR